MIRKATIEDLKDIMEITKKVIFEMNSYNNYQWDKNYPQEKDFIKDVENKDLYIKEKEGEIAAFICINKVEPIEYKELNWSSKDEAILVHRMAVNPDYRKRGIAIELMNFAENLALKNNIKYFKTDTNSLNIKMNRLLKKCGYTFVGEVKFLEKESPFYCYEKILEK